MEKINESIFENNKIKRSQMTKVCGGVGGSSARTLVCINGSSGVARPDWNVDGGLGDVKVLPAANNNSSR